MWMCEFSLRLRDQDLISEQSNSTTGWDSWKSCGLEFRFWFGSGVEEAAWPLIFFFFCCFVFFCFGLFFAWQESQWLSLSWGENNGRECLFVSLLVFCCISWCRRLAMAPREDFKRQHCWCSLARFHSSSGRAHQAGNKRRSKPVSDRPERVFPQSQIIAALLAAVCRT